MNGIRRALPWALLGTSLCRVAWADPPSDASSVAAQDARTLFDRGVALAAEERWAEAEQMFSQSEALVPRASTAYDRALALYRLGRLRDMLTELDHFIALSDPVADQADRESAERMRKSAEGALATLTLDVSPGNSKAELDHTPLPTQNGHSLTLLDPGDHEVVVHAPGFLDEHRHVTLAAGERTSLAVTLTQEPLRLTSRPEPPAPRKVPREPASPDHTLPILLTAAGAALLAGSAATGIAAATLNSRISDRCDGARCPPDLSDDQSRMWRFAIASDILLIGGTALVGSGVALFVWAPKSRSVGSASVSLWASPRGVSFQGSY